MYCTLISGSIAITAVNSHGTTVNANGTLAVISGLFYNKAVNSAV